MIMAVIPHGSGKIVLDELVNAGYKVTYSETRGGLLKQSQLSLYIGVEEKDIPAALKIIESNCRSHLSIRTERGAGKFHRSVDSLQGLGGTVVFIWNIDQIELF